MKIRVILASKFRNKDYENIVSEYIKRISGFGEAELIQLPDNKFGHLDNDATMSDRVAEKILKQTEDYYLISLDLTGRQFSSEGFASWLKERSELHRKLAFLIGPSGGLPKSLTEKSNELISLSKLTFAHKIATVVLFEQIYRAICINTNHPYHK